jgi:branched-chain amino acid transport system substrate-binding protein
MAIEDYQKAGGKSSVTTVVADYQNKPDIGANITREWYDISNVDAIVDVANSAVALAVSDITKQHNKVFLATGPATNRGGSFRQVHIAADAKRQGRDPFTE